MLENIMEQTGAAMQEVQLLSGVTSIFIETGNQKSSVCSLVQNIKDTADV